MLDRMSQDDSCYIIGRNETYVFERWKVSDENWKSIQTLIMGKSDSNN